jgi:hypothetical protein
MTSLLAESRSLKYINAEESKHLIHTKNEIVNPEINDMIAFQIPPQKLTENHRYCVSGFRISSKYQ